MKKKSAICFAMFLLTTTFTHLANGDGDPPVDPPIEDCPSCSDDWTTEPVAPNGTNGVECQHGPDSSPDCYYCYTQTIAEYNGVTRIVMEKSQDGGCCETRAGQECWKQIKDPGGDTVFEEDELGEYYELVIIPECDEEGACRCMTCVPAKGCESQIKTRYARCNEVEEHEAAGFCRVEGEACEKEDQVTDIFGNTGCPIRKQQKQKIDGNQPCNGENDEDGDSAVHTFLCGGGGSTHTNCIGTNCSPDGPWIVVAVATVLPKCAEED